MSNKTNESRRAFMIKVGAAGVAASLGTQAIAATQRNDRPNIVFILADDMGFADLSCYGRRDYKTPNLDRLASQGMLFTRGYANSAVCSATRTALVTGRYQDRFEIGLEEPVKEGTDIGLPAGTPTMPGQLKRLGYETFLVGKWHLGSIPKYSPLKFGYDHFFGFQGGATDYFAHRFNPAEPASPSTGMFADDKPIERDGYMTDLLGDETVRIIRGASDKPFMISLHFNAPHWPWEGPDDIARSRTMKDIKDFSGGSLETYGKIVQRLDENVGKVLRALDETGAAKNTIVVFTSDNGGERFSDVWPLTGRKGELLEGGLRVPLLVRWPDRIKAGSRSSQMVMSMDWLPTLLAAAGGVPDPSSRPDGDNVLPVMLGAAPQYDRELFWRYKANQQAAVIRGNWKLLFLAGKEYLFDLAADEHERANVKDLHPEIFKSLRHDFDHWNRQMLPYPIASFSESARGMQPDRY
ncbi:Arylsulfatase [Pandoraea captiosa]|uniref:Arylsulfatase n=1 Tax=Pandoraea captiosa TaxID=2508302 RepID=A0A5E4ZTH1_9BURK|nr:sulfatase-like hydrolase/transferase [Pandoraea captiosa]VVE64671.1 Arylsulfatase [Pandoraea captiosa]